MQNVSPESSSTPQISYFFSTPILYKLAHDTELPHFHNFLISIHFHKSQD